MNAFYVKFVHGHVMHHKTIIAEDSREAARKVWAEYPGADIRGVKESRRSQA